MRKIDLLGFAMAVLLMPFGQAQAKAEFHMRLSEGQVLNYIAVQPSLTKLAPEIQRAGGQLPPKLKRKLEKVAKAHGFRDFKELENVAVNISIVMSGLQPDGTYLDIVDSIEKQIEDVKKDTSLSEFDRKQVLEELCAAIKMYRRYRYPENAVVVAKHRDAILAAL